MQEKIAEKLAAVLDEVYSTASKENYQETTSIEIPHVNSASPHSTVAVSKTLEEKQNNIMSFLNEIPVAEPVNFTRSPSKVRAI